MATADEFAQIALLFTDPLQREYEVIRPVVLFAETVAERSRQTALVVCQLSYDTLMASGRVFGQRVKKGLTNH